jgi:hypothetical protein
MICMPVERVTLRLALFARRTRMLLDQAGLSFDAGSSRDRREQKRKPSERSTD